MAAQQAASTFVCTARAPARTGIFDPLAYVCAQLDIPLKHHDAASDALACHDRAQSVNEGFRIETARSRPVPTAGAPLVSINLAAWGSHLAPADLDWRRNIARRPEHLSEVRSRICSRPRDFRQFLQERDDLPDFWIGRQQSKARHAGHVDAVYDPKQSRCTILDDVLRSGGSGRRPSENFAHQHRGRRDNRRSRAQHRRAPAVTAPASNGIGGLPIACLRSIGALRMSAHLTMAGSSAVPATL